jgi:hypothetical protein
MAKDAIAAVALNPALRIRETSDCNGESIREFSRQSLELAKL